MNAKHVLHVLLGIVLTGCAISPPIEIARVPSNEPMLETARMIEDQAKSCWERSATVWKDGITIDARMSLHDSALISAARWASDIGVQDEFLIIEVVEASDDTSTVIINEGDYACGMDGSCSSLGLGDDVLRWLDNDFSCGEGNEVDQS